MPSPQVQEDGRSLLHHVFEALLTGVRTGSMPSPQRNVASPTSTIPDFDPDIHSDANLRGETWGNSPSRMKSRTDEGPASVVQLAARTILAHLVNHLNHFPQAVGAASLSSQVSEHDDVPSLVSEELNTETFLAPNIQLFVLNNTTLLSFVEIPCLDQTVADIATAASQVR